MHWYLLHYILCCGNLINYYNKEMLLFLSVLFVGQGVVPVRGILGSPRDRRPGRYSFINRVHYSPLHMA